MVGLIGGKGGWDGEVLERWCGDLVDEMGEKDVWEMLL